MFENITYELILQRMLARVREAQPNLDTREGSVIFTALAPAAVELQNMYIGLDHILNESFADTQTRDYLIKRCAERGIIVETATKAIRKGIFNVDIPIGARFSLNTLNYIAVERIAPGVYRMECETPGNIGNAESGMLIPIEYIDGLTSAQLTEVLIPGEDDEDTEHLRQRYFDSLDAQAFGGNIQDYKEKVTALKGVGGVKVYPVWNGGGTVRLAIIDSMYAKPSSTLIEEVQTAIDPVQNQGKGVGIAPIGHVVTVTGVEETRIDVVIKITYQAEWTWEDVRARVEACIDQYFKELSADWHRNDALTVRISQIETRVLDLPGVIDVQDTRLNGVAQNMVLGADCIPVRGGVSADG